jgi:hypothetical protein
VKTPFAVWETEYPEEGSSLIFALTEKGARHRYRRRIREMAPGVAELVPLAVQPISLAEALALARSAT